MSPSDALPDPGAPFSEPWHAQIFALTHKLAHAGHYSWPEWADRFSAQRALSAKGQAPDGDEKYYEDWLIAFEALLIEKNLADPAALAKLKQAWAQAYLETPHGKPVNIRQQI